MNENQVMVQAVKTFHGEEGPKNPASAPFPVSRARFADLAANGLVVEAEASEVVIEPAAGDPTAAALPADEAGTGATAVTAEAPAEAKPGRGARTK